MDRARFGIGDNVWEKIEALLPGKKSDRGVTAKDKPAVSRSGAMAYPGGVALA
jgi:hypothetical protein